MKRQQQSTFSVLRTAMAEALADEPFVARNTSAQAPAPDVVRFPRETRDVVDFGERIRRNVEAARQAERDPWSSRHQPALGSRGYRADELVPEVQRIFRQAVAASGGALRYSTSLRLEGTAHTLEWVEPAPRRSLTIVVNERAVIWSWLAPDRKSLDNRVDPLLVDAAKIEALVVDLTDHVLWSGDAVPSFLP